MIDVMYFLWTRASTSGRDDKSPEKRGVTRPRDYQACMPHCLVAVTHSRSCLLPYCLSVDDRRLDKLPAPPGALSETPVAVADPCDSEPEPEPEARDRSLMVCKLRGDSGGTGLLLPLLSGLVGAVMRSFSIG